MIVLLSCTASGQADTVQMAKELCAQRHFKAAEKLLAVYTPQHNDAGTRWYYAQVAHWAQDERVAEKNFKRAINQDPDDLHIRLGYARMLFESDKLNAAQKQLNRVLSKDKNDVEAHLIKGNIEFWYGRIRAAKTDIGKVRQQYPDNATANALQTDINIATAPYIKYTAGYHNDDQPMQSVSNKVESGVFCSWLLNPLVQVTSQDFYVAHRWNATIWASAGNKFLFGKTGTDVSLSAGAFKNFTTTADWTGDATIHQKLYKFLYVQVEAERKPYLSTYTSTYLALMQSTLSAALIIDKSNSWSAQAAYRYQFYNDKNPIQTAYIWALSQPVRASVFQFRFGYSYNYSTSKESRFTSTKTVSQILANYTANEQISGVYMPYFTPLKQHTNSVIIVVNIHPVKFMDIGIKADVGFYAQAQNPYLFLDTNPVDSVFINSGAAKQVFHPYKLSANVDFKIGKKVTLGADYTYTSGFFYSSHYTSFHLAISFLKHAG